MPRVSSAICQRRFAPPKVQENQKVMQICPQDGTTIHTAYAWQKKVEADDFISEESFRYQLTVRPRESWTDRAPIAAIKIVGAVLAIWVTYRIIFGGDDPE